MYPALLTNLGCGPQLRSHLKGFWIREQLFLEIPSLHLFSLDNQCEFIHSGSQFFLKRCPGFCTWWCPGCLNIHLSPSLTGWWCPAVCLHLSPYICFPIWLMVSGSPDVSLYSFPFNGLSPGMPSAAPVFGCLSLLVSRHLTPSLASVVRVSGCFSSLVSLHLSPALSSGIRLVFGCLFFAFTSLSSGVSFHVSPNLLVSQLICLQSRV